jgi:hypothetical protein
MASPHNRNSLLKSHLKAFPAGCEWLPHLVGHTLENSDQCELAWELPVRPELGRLIAGRNLFLLSEFGRVLQQLHTAGVPVIVLKGVALCEGVYPHLGIRTFGDMDLLIQRPDLTRVSRILMELGFQPGFLSLRPGGEDFIAHTLFEKPGLKPIIVEPHWSLGPPYPNIDGINYLPGLWERAVKATVAGVDTLVLSPEDFLLHLCLHLFKHRLGPFWLVSACDITEFVHCYQKSLDWQAFLQRARDWKVVLPTHFSLAKTAELFQPPIPRLVLNTLMSHQPSRRERFLFILLNLFNLPQSSITRPLFSLQLLLGQPGLQLKLRYLGAWLFPSEAFMFSRYNIKGHLAASHYLRRLGEGAALTLTILAKFARFPSKNRFR